jgi:outer membrane protein assembly factor BamB
VRRRRFLALAGSAAATGVAGCGYRPGGGDIRWQSDFGRPMGGWSSIGLADGRLFAVAESVRDFDFETEEWVEGASVSAYGTTDGLEYWSEMISPVATTSVVDTDGVALGLGDEVVRFGSDGEQWRTTVGGTTRALAVAEDAVYALTEAGTLVGLADGSERWRVDLRDVESDELFEPAVAAGAETVVCWVGGSVHGFASDGRRRFRQPEIDVLSLSVADGDIFAVAGHGLAALDRSTGESRWIGDERIQRFAATPDGVYGVFDGDVYAYDRSGGRRWSTNDDSETGRNRAVDDSTDYTGRVVAGVGGVYVDSSRGLTAIDPGDGSVRWRVGNKSISAGPFLVENGVLVAAEGELVCHVP